MRGSLGTWLLVIFAAMVLFFVQRPAQAEESYVATYAVPVLIGGAAVFVARRPYLNSRCNDEPCNTISHLALGAGVSMYVRREYGWKAALLSGVVVGVGKEWADKNFDVKDALATIAGSALAVSWEW